MLCAKGQLAGVAATKGREKSVLQQVQAVGTVKCKPSELVAHTGVGSSYYCLSLGELGDLLLDIKRFLVFLGRRSWKEEGVGNRNREESLWLMEECLGQILKREAKTLRRKEYFHLCNVV